ncbi:hypothetical protein SUGI_1070820 [Cryptomeria japonica]|uniref:photosynthetic NDH subunit of subcomplex B 4, chloroplastic isoform X1 n=1 Tax=Cryptomeria japonica TaxID=3369 RepID=UPI002414C92F|nr:photosynthetic NDH subunit of subcomplex B 4, chloroplastic isoform X1 [Cryptomeria japonica]GLJ50281.1 hypothetical protein SUGI_1070820 [Cryptomeria japonica]
MATASATLVGSPIRPLRHHSEKTHCKISHTWAQVQCYQGSRFSTCHSQNQAKVGSSRLRAGSWRIHAFPDLSWYSLAVEQLPEIIERSNWHLDEEATKNVYTFYICFTIWGCCVFGSMKDPFYDGDPYRKDGGDGSQNWMYEKEEQDEASAREELLREELIQEIERKVGGLSKLEEAEKKEKEPV